MRLWTFFYLELVSQRHFVMRFFIFVMTALIYIFLIQAEPASLAYASKVLVLLAVLTLLTEIECFFSEDWSTGRLELWLAEGAGLEGILMRKLLIFWVFGVLPLLLTLAIFFKSLGLPFPVAFAQSFMLAGVTVTAIGSLLSILLLGVQRPVLLGLLLMLPLIFPEILVTLGTYEQVLQGGPTATLLCLQLGISCVSLALCLLAIPAIVRWSVQ